MVARELGVSSKDVREMESRMAAQDMTFDMSSDDESDSQPMAPVLYLQDKRLTLPTASKTITGKSRRRIS